MTHVEQIIAELCLATSDKLGAVSLNQLADYYRNGEDLRTLVPLLNHQNPEIVSGAAWIAAEVIDSQHGREVFDELKQLLGHRDPGVRFSAISSVAQLVTADDRETLQQLLLLTGDENTGVRQQACRCIAGIPEKTLSGDKR